MQWYNRYLFAKKGLIAGDSPEKMNIENPEIIKMMAKHYYEAGSDIVLTNSFGGKIYAKKIWY